LIPADLEASYRALLAAVQKSDISSQRLNESVLKILRAKASLKLQRNRLVSEETLNSVIGQPQNLALGQQVADDAITLVRDNGKVLPLKSKGTAVGNLPYQTVEEVRNDLVVVIFSDDVRTEAGRVLERQIRSRVADANVMYVDSRIAPGISPQVLAA